EKVMNSQEYFFQLVRLNISASMGNLVPEINPLFQYLNNLFGDKRGRTIDSMPNRKVGKILGKHLSQGRCRRVECKPFCFREQIYNEGLEPNFGSCNPNKQSTSRQ